MTSPRRIADIDVAQLGLGHLGLALDLLDALARLADVGDHLRDLLGARRSMPPTRASGVLLAAGDALAVLRELLGVGFVSASYLTIACCAVEDADRLLQLVDDDVHLAGAERHLRRIAWTAGLIASRRCSIFCCVLGGKAFLPDFGSTSFSRSFTSRRSREMCFRNAVTRASSRLGRALGVRRLLVLVAEEVAAVDLAVTQAVGEVQHVLQRERKREDGLAHLELAGLDAPWR